MNDDDWQSRIKVLINDIYLPHDAQHEIWKIEDSVRHFEVAAGPGGVYPKVGTLVFARRRRRKLRTRYIVMQVVNEWGTTRPTNAEIVYRKSSRRWVVFIAGSPVNDGYVKLAACKASFRPHPLDRLAAEAPL